jgi:hypothetical protein
LAPWATFLETTSFSRSGVDCHRAEALAELDHGSALVLGGAVAWSQHGMRARMLSSVLSEPPALRLAVASNAKVGALASDVAAASAALLRSSPWAQARTTPDERSV